MVGIAKLKLNKYHLETLRKVMMYDKYLSEATLVLRGNKLLDSRRKIRFSRHIVDEAVYEMLESMEIEGSCAIGWRKVGMDTEDAKHDYHGIPDATLPQDGRSGGVSEFLRNISSEA